MHMLKNNQADTKKMNFVEDQLQKIAIKVENNDLTDEVRSQASPNRTLSETAGNNSDVP